MNTLKLERVLNRPKKRLWVVLFILGLAVVVTMATSYNFEVLKTIPDSFPKEFPLYKIFFGALGFFGILGSLVLLFARLLREMKINQIQAEFLDRISHELRTPLSTLTLVSDLIRSENVSPEESTQLWKSYDIELSRLKTDVELLLQAAHLRESKLKPELSSINLEKWLTDRWETFKLILGPQAKIERVGEPIGVNLDLDSSLLEMIVRNLLDNARKFSMEQTVVTVKSEVFLSGIILKKKKWRLSIVDEGLGFRPQQQTQLFKQFSRLPLQQSELKPASIPGTGLGLYLSAMASKAMGLTLTGQSRGEGKGAIFSLEGKY